MVSALLSLWLAAKMTLPALSIDLLKPAATRKEEIYIRGHLLNIFEGPKMMLCKDSKVDRKYASGTPALLK